MSSSDSLSSEEVTRVGNFSRSHSTVAADDDKFGFVPHTLAKTDELDGALLLPRASELDKELKEGQAKYGAPNLHYSVQYPWKRTGQLLAFDCTLEAISNFGGSLFAGARIRINKGSYAGTTATVIGVRDGFLWRHDDDANGAGAFNCSSAKDLEQHYDVEVIGVAELPNVRASEKSLTKPRASRKQQGRPSSGLSRDDSLLDLVHRTGTSTSVADEETTEEENEEEDVEQRRERIYKQWVTSHPRLLYSVIPRHLQVTHAPILEPFIYYLPLSGRDTEAGIVAPACPEFVMYDVSPSSLKEYALKNAPPPAVQQASNLSVSSAVDNDIRAAMRIGAANSMRCGRVYMHTSGPYRGRVCTIIGLYGGKLVRQYHGDYPRSFDSVDLFSEAGLVPLAYEHDVVEAPICMLLFDSVTKTQGLNANARQRGGIRRLRSLASVGRQYSSKLRIAHSDSESEPDAKPSTIQEEMRLCNIDVTFFLPKELLQDVPPDIALGVSIPKTIYSDAIKFLGMTFRAPPHLSLLFGLTFGMRLKVRRTATHRYTQASRPSAASSVSVSFLTPTGFVSPTHSSKAASPTLQKLSESESSHWKNVVTRMELPTKYLNTPMVVVGFRSFVTGSLFDPIAWAALFLAATDGHHDVNPHLLASIVAFSQAEKASVPSHHAAHLMNSTYQPECAPFLFLYSEAFDELVAVSPVAVIGRTEIIGATLGIIVSTSLTPECIFAACKPIESLVEHQRGSNALLIGSTGNGDLVRSPSAAGENDSELAMTSSTILSDGSQIPMALSAAPMDSDPLEERCVVVSSLTNLQGDPFSPECPASAKRMKLMMEAYRFLEVSPPPTTIASASITKSPDISSEDGAGSSSAGDGVNNSPAIGWKDVTVFSVLQHVELHKDLRGAPITMGSVVSILTGIWFGQQGVVVGKYVCGEDCGLCVNGPQPPPPHLQVLLCSTKEVVSIHCGMDLLSVQPYKRILPPKSNSVASEAKSGGSGKVQGKASGGPSVNWFTWPSVFGDILTVCTSPAATLPYHLHFMQRVVYRERALRPTTRNKNEASGTSANLLQDSDDDELVIPPDSYTASYLEPLRCRSDSGDASGREWKKGTVAGVWMDTVWILDDHSLVLQPLYGPFETFNNRYQIIVTGLLESLPVFFDPLLSIESAVYCPRGLTSASAKSQSSGVSDSDLLHHLRTDTVWRQPSGSPSTIGLVSIQHLSSLLSPVSLQVSRNQQPSLGTNVAFRCVDGFAICLGYASSELLYGAIARGADKMGRLVRSAPNMIEIVIMLQKSPDALLRVMEDYVRFAGTNHTPATLTVGGQIVRDDRLENPIQVNGVWKHHESRQTAVVLGTALGRIMCLFHCDDRRNLQRHHTILPCSPLDRTEIWRWECDPFSVAGMSSPTHKNDPAVVHRMLLNEPCTFETKICSMLNKADSTPFNGGSTLLVNLLRADRSLTIPLPPELTWAPPRSFTNITLLGTVSENMQVKRAAAALSAETVFERDSKVRSGRVAPVKSLTQRMFGILSSIGSPGMEHVNGDGDDIRPSKRHDNASYGASEIRLFYEPFPCQKSPIDLEGCLGSISSFISLCEEKCAADPNFPSESEYDSVVRDMGRRRQTPPYSTVRTLLAGTPKHKVPAVLSMIRTACYLGEMRRGQTIKSAVIGIMLLVDALGPGCGAIFPALPSDAEWSQHQIMCLLDAEKNDRQRLVTAELGGFGSLQIAQQSDQDSIQRRIFEFPSIEEKIESKTRLGINEETLLRGKKFLPSAWLQSLAAERSRANSLSTVATSRRNIGFRQKGHAQGNSFLQRPPTLLEAFAFTSPLHSPQLGSSLRAINFSQAPKMVSFLEDKYLCPFEYILGCGSRTIFDISAETCSVFGMYHGQRFLCTKGDLSGEIVTILGVCGKRLWRYSSQTEACPFAGKNAAEIVLLHGLEHVDSSARRLEKEEEETKLTSPSPSSPGEPLLVRTADPFFYHTTEGDVVSFDVSDKTVHDEFGVRFGDRFAVRDSMALRNICHVPLPRKRMVVLQSSSSQRRAERSKTQPQEQLMFIPFGRITIIGIREGRLWFDTDTSGAQPFLGNSGSLRLELGLEYLYSGCVTSTFHNMARGSHVRVCAQSKVGRVAVDTSSASISLFCQDVHCGTAVTISKGALVGLRTVIVGTRQGRLLHQPHGTGQCTPFEYPSTTLMSHMRFTIFRGTNPIESMEEVIIRDFSAVSRQRRFRYLSLSGDVYCFDTTDSACKHAYGFGHGDRLQLTKPPKQAGRMVVVLGVRNNQLWCVDECDGGAFVLHGCFDHQSIISTYDPLPAGRSSVKEFVG